ncbi:hypothetical protein WN093_00010 [Gammaproteobacteria bacterium AS21]
MAYQKLLKEEENGPLIRDQVRAAIHIYSTITAMTNGLESSALGKQQIDKILFKDPSPSSDMLYDIAAMSKAISSFILDLGDIMIAAISDMHDDMSAAKNTVVSASDKFLITLASSPKATKMFADEVKSLGIKVGQTNKKPKPLKIKKILQDIAKMQGLEIDIKRTKLRHFINDINSHTRSINKWNESSMVKYYGSLLDEDLKVLTINDSSHFKMPTGAIQGLGSVAFAAHLFGVLVTGPDLQTLQNKNASRAKEMLGLKNVYDAVVLAEVAAFALRANADEIIGGFATKVLKHIKVPTRLGVNPNVATGNLKPFAFAAAKNLLKTAPVIGMIDCISNIFQVRAYNDRNDLDATVFAGSHAVGGGLLVLAALASAAGVLAGATAAAIAVLAAPIAAAGVVLTLIGVAGKMIFENGDLENWVAEGFWSGKENWYGSMPKYLYWGNVIREDIAFIFDDKSRIKNFSAQLEIAKLISGGKGQAEFPKVESDEIAQFMRREISDYHSQRYGPNIKKSNDTVVAVLPEFAVGLSVLELRLEVTEEGFVGSDLNNYSTTHTMYVYDMPGDGEEYWQRTPNSDIFHLTPIYHTMKQVAKIHYAYYPQGKGEQTLMYKNVIEWSFFD